MKITAVPETAIIVPIIDFQVIFSLKIKYETGNRIIGGNAIIVEAIPT
jgi:hypothetical protein